jgi:hypothetical protein
MLTACCDHSQQLGRPFLHNQDFMVKNLCLLFANVPEVTIDDYGSLKHSIREAIHEQYWNQLVACLIDRQAELPPCPDEWPRPRQSPRNHDAPPPPPTSNLSHLRPLTRDKEQLPRQPPLNMNAKTSSNQSSIHLCVPPHHVDNDLYLPLLKQMENATTYLSKLDVVSAIPSRYSALGLEPPNVKSNLLTGG